MAAVEVAYLVAALTLFGGFAWWLGVHQGRRDEHDGCELLIRRVRSDRVSWERYASDLEQTCDVLRLQVRGLAQQLHDAGGVPWTSEFDTPPAPVRRRPSDV